MQLQVLQVADARSELEQKSILEIEKETALTWGARAAAAYELARQSSDQQRMRWVMDGENYRQESLEHGAMTGDLEFLQRLMDDLEAARSLLEGV